MGVSNFRIIQPKLHLRPPCLERLGFLRMEFFKESLIFAETIKNTTMSRTAFHLIIGILLFPLFLPAQDSIRVHFKYGSKPGKGFKKVEKHWFGGIHGGHVSIETEEGVFGFGPKGKFHVIARRGEDKRHSYFQYETMPEFQRDSAGLQYLSVILPVTRAQMDSLNAIHKCHREKPPYDYAFLGMRCAASTYDVLADVGITKKRSQKGTWRKYFYPRKMRNMMVKRADQEGWRMVRHSGSHRRKWERDLKKTARIIDEKAEAMP